jgi:eukaryotic-like serine/threonine-protein kinase
MRSAAGRIYLGKYETVRLLGEGGMGSVFLARTLRGDEPVVIKIMHEHIAGEAHFRQRFEQEIRLMAAFRHAHAVGFIEAGDDPTGPCLVMEFAPGVTLDKLLAKNKRFSPMRVRRILGQFCDVLQAAHDAGIIHRDLKPANVMVLDPDTPFEKLKVMDFGLAEMAGPPPPGTLRQYAVGTPGYMSPEQVAGGAVDHRGDIYSVGAILYQLLTGSLPFPGSSPMEILMAQASKPPLTFAALGMADKVPAPVEAVIRSCLAADPAERHDSARLLGEAYETALVKAYGRPAEQEPAAAPASVAPPTAPPVNEPSLDPDALVETLEAYMPEASAAYKVKAFVEEFHGKVLESRPGLIRLWFRAPTKETGSLLSLIGLRRRVGPIEVELQLAHRDTANKNRLSINLLFRPQGGGKAPDFPEWRARCQQIYRGLSRYLMTQT